MRPSTDRTIGNTPSRYLALSGTPGTGKTSIGRVLPKRFRVREVADLALENRMGRRLRSGVEVELGRLARWLARQPPPDRTTLIVGHLAHLLPVQEVILLRCYPLELDQRLRRARRGSERTRHENAESEALDSILVEALELERTVHEVDTSGRSVRSVSREVGRLAARPLEEQLAEIDWLADPRVTDFLLRGAS